MKHIPFPIYMALRKLWARFTWWLMTESEKWAQSAAYDLQAEEHYASERIEADDRLALQYDDGNIDVYGNRC